MIGILKTLGAKAYNIRKIFLYFSAIIIAKAFLWGNVAAFILLFLQYQFKIISLDPESYYVDSVPVSFPLLYFLLLNIAGIIFTTLMLVIPSAIISRISPAKVIRFD